MPPVAGSVGPSQIACSLDGFCNPEPPRSNPTNVRKPKALSLPEVSERLLFFIRAVENNEAWHRWCN
ncbi:hypothetical protein MES4922_210014 [Mesorhizobium ventifaucium]|uniref:Uncharacterized protein n=1 Tax=Mesorhizobium ventifaucium TaxID=666020 RepID=A0ABN8JLJ5_9HYPH|nr:hypothetical protein MES4922_210014 [Mesorhizobium ventifaucium]